MFKYKISAVALHTVITDIETITILLYIFGWSRAFLRLERDAHLVSLFAESQIIDRVSGKNMMSWIHLLHFQFLAH